MIVDTEVAIETNRLRIIPLNISQLEKYQLNDFSLEDELKLKKASRQISYELKEAMALTIIPSILDNPENYLLSTLWIVIHKIENRIIAGITFMAIDGSDGEIEIGYGTDEEYWNKGFMTEAIGGMIQWAKMQEGIKAIIASTEKSNVSSHKVLIKNEFKKFNETNEMICWQFRLK